jgi:hypothetical protein
MKKIARAIPKMEDGIIQQAIAHSLKIQHSEEVRLVVEATHSKQVTVLPHHCAGIG